MLSRCLGVIWEGSVGNLGWSIFEIRTPRGLTGATPGNPPEASRSKFHKFFHEGLPTFRWPGLEFPRLEFPLFSFASRRFLIVPIWCWRIQAAPIRLEKRWKEHAYDQNYISKIRDVYICTGEILPWIKHINFDFCNQRVAQAGHKAAAAWKKTHSEVCSFLFPPMWCGDYFGIS